MINVVKSLLFRLKKSSLFWSLLGVCALSPLLSALIQWWFLDIAQDVTNMPLDSLGMEYVTYSTLSSLASIDSDVGLFSLICTSVFLCKEFTDGTIRNTILSNKKRSSVFFGYLFVGVIIGMTYLLANYVMSLLALGIPFGFGVGTPTKDILSACLCSLLLGIFATLFVVSCVLMFLFATGKQSAGIVYPLLVIIFLPGLIAGIVELIATLMLLANEITPFESWIPLYNAMLFDSSQIDGALIAKILMYYVVFTAGFVLLGNLAATKKDLK